VEAAACPLVLPANATATLGTVRNHLRDAAGKWEIILPAKDGTAGAVTPVVEMMTALWGGAALPPRRDAQLPSTAPTRGRGGCPPRRDPGALAEHWHAAQEYSITPDLVAAALARSGAQ